MGSLGENTQQGAISPAYIVFEVSSDVAPEFLYRYLKSSIGLGLIKWYGDRGGVRSALRYDDLCDIDIPDLSYSQQLTALDFIMKAEFYLNRLLKSFLEQKKNVQFLRQKILDTAIEGRLCSQSYSDESASSLLDQIQKEKRKRLGTTKRKDTKLLKANSILPALAPQWTLCKLIDIS